VSAAQYSEQYYQRALRVRSMIRADFESAFDSGGAYRLDALLTPTTPTTAFKIADIYGDSVLMQYADQLTVPANHAGIPGISIPGGLDADQLTVPANHAGIPGISIPGGLDGDGLPIGIQLLAPDFREEILFRVGYAFEQATADAAWRKHKPQVLR